MSDTTKRDEWSDRIDAAFPTRSGSHDAYATAMCMVGNRHEKKELVALVNWLLVENEAQRLRAEKAEATIVEMRRIAEEDQAHRDLLASIPA